MDGARYRAPSKSAKALRGALSRKEWFRRAGGRRMAPFLAEIVDRLRALGQVDVDVDLAARLCSISAATINRRSAGERARLQVRGRWRTKPGSLLKSQIPIRPGPSRRRSNPGFVEIDVSLTSVRPAR